MAVGITAMRMKVLVRVGMKQPKDLGRIDLFHVAKDLGVAFKRQPTVLIAARELKEGGLLSLQEDGERFSVRLTKKGQVVYEAVASVLNPSLVAEPASVRPLGQILRGET